MDTAIKVVITIALLFVGIVGLGMALCGATFSVGALHDIGNSPGIYAIAIPSIIVGALLVRWMWKINARLWRAPDEPPQQS